jgi:phosphoserine phosphatase
MPIEMDASIPREEKLKHTEAWWSGDMKAFSSAGYSRRDFEKMTKESKLLFRRGTQDLLRLCKKLDIPLVIVSGGIHELIEESLRLLEE